MDNSTVSSFNTVTKLGGKDCLKISNPNLEEVKVRKQQPRKLKIDKNEWNVEEDSYGVTLTTIRNSRSSVSTVKCFKCTYESALLIFLNCDTDDISSHYQETPFLVYNLNLIGMSSSCIVK